MNTLPSPPETQPGHNGAAPIQNLLTYLLNTALQDQGNSDLWQEATNAWETHPEVILSQDGAVGRFRRDSIAYCLGSLSTYSIFVEASTATGPRPIQLRLDGGVPAFSIKTLEVAPTRADYAGVGIHEAFDWNTIMRSVNETRTLNQPPYLVVFRSQLKPNADVKAILEHDRKAHEAALKSPALIHYFGGETNEAGQSLSFCLWENDEAAREVARDINHIKASKMVREYEDWSIERYDVHVTDGQVHLNPRAA